MVGSAWGPELVLDTLRIETVIIWHLRSQAERQGERGERRMEHEG